MTAARKKLTAIIAFAMAGVMLLGGTGMIIGGIAGKNGGGAATPVFLAPDPLGDRPDFDPAVLVNPIDKTARAENGFSYSGDAGAKTIKITGGRYTASIRYDKKFLIDSMSVDGETVLGLDNGIYTSHKADGTVYTSLSLAADPAVHIDETNLEFGAVYFTFTYDDGIAVVQARVTARKESMALRLNRKFKTAATLSSQSFPMLKVEQDFTESIRWLESGSNFWVSGEGDDLERFLSAKRFKADKNLKRAMDEINFALLTGIEKRVALRVSGGTADAVPTPANANKRIPRQYSTEADRAPLENGKRHLTLNVNMPKAGTNLKFGTGDADWGWQTGGGDYTGSIRPTGSETVFAPVSFAASDENTLTLTFAPADWEDFFDLGELYGIDEANAAQAINSFARLAVIGKDVGTTLEYPHYFIELPPIQQQWNASLVSIFGDDAGMEAQKWSLRNIKNYIQKANGHMKSPYPGVPYDSWGHDYADMQLGYVTAIKNVYSYSGDKGFALEFKDSAERSLQYMFETYFDDEAKLATNVYKANPSDNPDKAYLTESHNDYWEKSVGEYNAYLTAHYYEALVSLAQLERYVYGDTVKADGYETLAAEIKTAFNKDKADGGCWVPGMQAYYYGTDNFDFAYLPVQAVAMRTGLADGARAVTLANKIEREQGSYNMGLNVMNALDIRNGTAPAPQTGGYDVVMVGENGGWYGAPAGEWYSAFVKSGDRGLIPYYTNAAMEKFSVTGFTGATTYLRDGVTSADDQPWHAMPTMAYTLWGLYSYGYGFQPGINDLDVAPFIHETMFGSNVNYRWRTRDISVKYRDFFSFDVTVGEAENASSVSGAVNIVFVNQTPGKEYTLSVNGASRTATADAGGSVRAVLGGAGEYAAELVNPDSEFKIAANGADVAFEKAVLASSTHMLDYKTDFWTMRLTEGAAGEAYYWRPAGDDGAPYLDVIVGKMYRVSEIKAYVAAGQTQYILVEGCNTARGKNWRAVGDFRGGLAPQTDGDGDYVKLPVDSAYRYYRIHFRGVANSRVRVRRIEIR